MKSSVRSRKLYAAKWLYCTLSLRRVYGPSRAAYLSPSLHYSQCAAEWRQTGIDCVWVQSAAALSRRGPQHLDTSLAIIRPGPISWSLSISHIDSDRNLISRFIMSSLLRLSNGAAFHTTPSLAVESQTAEPLCLWAEVCLPAHINKKRLVKSTFRVFNDTCSTPTSYYPGHNTKFEF